MWGACACTHTHTHTERNRFIQETSCQITSYSQTNDMCQHDLAKSASTQTNI